jgi:hypothetical protein
VSVLSSLLTDAGFVPNPWSSQYKDINEFFFRKFNENVERAKENHEQHLHFLIQVEDDYDDKEIIPDDNNQEFIPIENHRSIPEIITVEDSPQNIQDIQEAVEYYEDLGSEVVARSDV